VDWQEPTAWPDDVRRDRLIGDWHIYQRSGGHRTSTDDLITAWYAVHRNPDRPARYLDLGCGVGSVLLMVSHKLRPLAGHGIEAQPQSVLMAQRAVAELPKHDSAIQVEQADFRGFDTNGEPYDLVTGSPPYFPLNAGVLPDDAQRRACRFEARGGVEDYFAAAARALTARARFYLVFQTQARERVLSAATRHELHLTGQADFLMRSDRHEPFLSVFEFARSPVAEVHRFRCAVRDERGELSPDYMAIRRELGVESSS
jgi:tRNA1Val (adenine37-N6)-methyltransferase